MKLLVFVLVLVAFFWGQRLISRMGDKKPPASQGRRSTPEAERMLECRQCGLLVPESEGVVRNDTFYCCDAHARGRDD